MDNEALFILGVLAFVGALFLYRMLAGLRRLKFTKLGYAAIFISLLILITGSSFIPTFLGRHLFFWSVVIAFGFIRLVCEANGLRFQKEKRITRHSTRTRATTARAG
ncbi:MAG TPA: hypothetical protein VJS64_00020 [Pyrinomonadaceae bacterium]|nr:hypothetical protein [Pyrinomonadaceae bacterium]